MRAPSSSGSGGWHEMGYLFDLYGFQLFPFPEREGVCLECGRDHPEWAPHDRDTLQYQYRFFDEHGRWPSWEDAMAHCDEEVRAAWASELEARGIDVDARPEAQTARITIEADGGKTP